MNNIKSNIKRIKTCKKIGGILKNKGHKRENDFKKQYNKKLLKQKIQYGATSDTSISKKHNIIKKIKKKLLYNGLTYYCSNKSGKNIQFTLGKIIELETNNNIEWLKNKKNVHKLLGKYLKKNNSDFPADFLVYKNCETKKWIFFVMDDVIDFIANNCEWRKLSSGRIKGDFNDNSKRGKRQYITYEFRKTHNAYFLGLNGNKDKLFIELLQEKIKYLEDDFDYK